MLVKLREGYYVLARDVAEMSVGDRGIEVRLVDPARLVRIKTDPFSESAHRRLDALVKDVNTALGAGRW